MLKERNIRDPACIVAEPPRQSQPLTWKLWEQTFNLETAEALHVLAKNGVTWGYEELRIADIAMPNDENELRELTQLLIPKSLEGEGKENQISELSLLAQMVHLFEKSRLAARFGHQMPMGSTRFVAALREHAKLELRDALLCFSLLLGRGIYMLDLMRSKEVSRLDLTALLHKNTVQDIAAWYLRVEPAAFCRHVSKSLSMEHGSRHAFTWSGAQEPAKMPDPKSEQHERPQDPPRVATRRPWAPSSAQIAERGRQLRLNPPRGVVPSESDIKRRAARSVWRNMERRDYSLFKR